MINLKCVCVDGYKENETQDKCVPDYRELSETCDDTFVCDPDGRLVCDTTVSVLIVKKELKKFQCKCESGYEEKNSQCVEIGAPESSTSSTKPTTKSTTRSTTESTTDSDEPPISESSSLVFGLGLAFFAIILA